MSEVSAVPVRESSRNGFGKRCMVLIAGPVEDPRSRRSVFNDLEWPVVRVPTCAAAARFAQLRQPRVIVCDRDLPDGTWRDVLEMAASLDERPPLIVTSRLADDYLWAEVLNLGGYDVLAKPFDEREVRRSLALACRHISSSRGCHAAGMS
jgi:DNA-binding response OmpR family regulator